MALARYRITVEFLDDGTCDSVRTLATSYKGKITRQSIGPNEPGHSVTFVVDTNEPFEIGASVFG